MVCNHMYSKGIALGIYEFLHSEPLPPMFATALFSRKIPNYIPSRKGDKKRQCSSSSYGGE